MGLWGLVLTLNPNSYPNQRRAVHPAAQRRHAATRGRDADGHAARGARLTLTLALTLTLTVTLTLTLTLAITLALALTRALTLALALALTLAQVGRALLCAPLLRTDAPGEG